MRWIVPVQFYAFMGSNLYSLGVAIQNYTTFFGFDIDTNKI